MVTNDLVTKEDAERLQRERADRSGAGRRGRDRRLPAYGDPRGPDAQHRRRRAAREANVSRLDLIIIESGGDNLASTFSLDLVDHWMFVIDVARGDDIPRKRGPGIAPVRPAGHQQDRPRSLCRRRCRGDPRRGDRGARRPADHRLPLSRRRRKRGRPGRRRDDQRATSSSARWRRRRDGDAAEGSLCAPLARCGPNRAASTFGRRLAHLPPARRTHFPRRPVDPAPVPHHRPFYRPGDPAGMATLYLQSSSGGLYGDDRLDLRIVAEAGARAHVTSQASTMVPASHGGWARLGVRLRLEAGATLEYVPDPLILFDGADADTTLDVSMAPDTTAIVADAVLLHNPAGGMPASGRWTNTITITADGEPLPRLIERQRLDLGDRLRLRTAARRRIGSARALLRRALPGRPRHRDRRRGALGRAGGAGRHRPAARRSRMALLGRRSAAGERHRRRAIPLR